jgi:phenylalanyl-tRNA synthetase beta chain
MKISLNWISEFIDLSGIDIDDLVHQLTMAGLEVEEVIELETVNNVVTAKVVSKEKHPNADKLSVCVVDDGSEKYNVVCGAPNVDAGQIIPFAKVGAVLPGGFKIKKAKIRGFESFGMICSASELGIEEGKSDGILILPDNLELGQDVNDILGLGDTVIDISITPNRADCLSILGIARDIAAIYDLPIDTKKFSVKETADKASDIRKVIVKNEEACPVYLGRIIKGIQIKESPLWMQARLRAVGVRPINNVVDVTNYILFEYGQPLHTFDNDILEGNIIVRNAKKGEKLLTLDGKERELKEDMLVIADEKKALAVAGVMGGEHSGISDETKDIFLECAYFKPESIRMTARRLGLHSDSSYRFERGIDRAATLEIIDYAASLIQEVAGGDICKGVTSNDYKKVSMPEIEITVEKINSLLGTDVSENEMVKILDKLNFKHTKKGDAYVVIPPSYRVDIERLVDVAEEVARLYGYDNIQTTIPEIKADSEAVSGLQKQIRIVKQIFKTLGFNEVINYSFLNDKFLNIFDDESKFVKLQNPISEDMNTLRTFVFPGVISSIKYNYNQGFKSSRLFEVASTFIKNEDNLPVQKTNLSFGQVGSFWKQIWNNKLDSDNFFMVKGVVEHLLASFKLNFSFVRSEREFLHPGRSAEIMIDNKSYGFFGELHPDTAEKIDFNESLYICEIFLEELVELIDKVDYKYTAFSKFPSVNKDVSVIVDESIFSGDILNAIKQTNDLIENVELLDVYKGKGVEDGMVSLMFRIYYSDVNKTLTDEETNESLNEIIEMLKDKFGAKLR